MAVTGSTAIWSKAVSARCTLVTPLSNHVGFTATLTSDPVTLSTERPLRVALTLQGSIMQDGRDAADELGAHLCQHGHGHGHEGVQTHVAHHLITALLRRGVVTLETRQLRVLGDQHQRINKDESSQVSLGHSVTLESDGHDITVTGLKAERPGHLDIPVGSHKEILLADNLI